MRSSITIGPDEHRLLQQLRASLALDSNINVVRRALQLLNAQVESQRQRAEFAAASLAARHACAPDNAELDALAADGLDP